MLLFQDYTHTKFNDNVKYCLVHFVLQDSVIVSDSEQLLLLSLSTMPFQINTAISTTFILHVLLSM